MQRLKEAILQIATGVSRAIFRFPFTVLCLASAAIVLCYMISLKDVPPLWLEKSVFTLTVGALLGMVTQFVSERFELRSSRLLLVYSVCILLAVGYLLILLPVPEISNEITVRTFVCIFAMVCLILWIPAIQGRANFNQVALVHFKSFFISALYSAVLFAGVSAIFFAVDRLLFRINTDCYSYACVIICVVFAPIYDLSLLPNFNSKNTDFENGVHQKNQYTRFIEILISYIAIPLFTTYTLVLLIYIIKIIVTSVWPIGLLGPMVLVYSAVGIILYVLASIPKNKIANLFLKVLPKVWIPIVIMQMISVWIRIRAYGITESRYYIALFAVFFLISSVILSIWPISKNQSIALLAAAFALFSILPPMDAFTISRNSQIRRLEGYLVAEGMLENGKLISKSTASEKTKIEVTNILNYLESHHTLEYISWLPDDFESWQTMKDAFGFGQTWPSYSTGEEPEFINFGLDTDKALDISGYDVSISTSSYRQYGYDYKTADPAKSYQFSSNGNPYVLSVERTSSFDVSIFLKDQTSQVLIEVNLQSFLETLQDSPTEQTELLPPEQMTFEVHEGDYQMKIVFQNISAMLSGQESGADYSALILIKTP